MLNEEKDHLALEFCMAKIEPFEKNSDAYDEWFARNRDLYEAELETVRQLIPPAGAEGLEVGVGSGKFAGPLGIKIGVEPSEQMAIKARQQGIDVYPGIAEDLPFPDKRFDFVLMVTTICFVDDIIETFREAFRVLKPGGFIVLAMGLKPSPSGEPFRFYFDLLRYVAWRIMEYIRRQDGTEPNDGGDNFQVAKS